MIPSLEHFGTHDESEFPHLWDGVVGAWCPSLGPTGLRLHDFSRRGNWGTLTNMDAATDWVVQDGQYALDFDGLNDRVDTGFLIPATDFTVSVWYNTSSLAETVFNRPCGDSDTATGLTGIGIVLNLFGGGDVYVVARQGANVGTGDTRGGAVAVGRWQHVAVTMDSVFGLALWVDGRIVSANSAHKFITPTSAGWKIGADATQSKFSGFIAENTVWNRVLSGGEIDLLYAIKMGGMFTPRRRRRAYSFGPTGLRRRLLMTGQT